MASKDLIVAGAVLALAAGMAIVPHQALAQRSRGGVVGGGGHAFVGSGGRAFVGGGGRVIVGGGGRGIVAGGGRAVVTRPGFAHHQFIHRPFVRPFGRSFFPFGIVATAPGFLYASPAYYPSSAYDPSPYYDPSSYSAPVGYGPPVSYAPTPSPTVAPAPAPPTPNVVEFSTGRYELRGDGVSTPYTWVWVPNPPSSPPPAAPTAPPSGDPRSSSKQTPARVGHLYSWTDAQGVVYWTDRLDAVPEQYRSRAKQTTPS